LGRNRAKENFSTSNANWYGEALRKEEKNKGGDSGGRRLKGNLLLPRQKNHRVERLTRPGA